MNINEIIKKLNAISFFQGEVTVKRLYGGLSNYSYLVTDSNKKYVARFLTNREHYHVLNFHELAASKAASEVGVAPKVVYNEKEFLIFEYIPSNTLTFENLKQEKYLKKIIFLLKVVHKNVANYFHGPALTFWPFHSIKDYARTLKEINRPYIGDINTLLDDSEMFENMLSPSEIVFSHGDMYPLNILDDGKKIWFIDWEHAGFNHALTDLASLSKHGELNQNEENYILEQYYKDSFSSKLMCQLNIIKCASIIREILWSMIAEIKLPIDYDFNNYTHKTLEKYKIQLDSFKSIYL